MLKPLHRRRGPFHHALMSCSAMALLLGPLHAGAATTAEQTQMQARQVQLDLPAQPLDQALTTFADQAGLHLLYTTGDVAGQVSPALQGNYSVEQALQQLLAGSGMSWQFSEARTVTLRKAEAAPQAVNLKP
ncbi:MAG: TonB-dependent siderophore receptor, partial [Pseudomonas sp.]|nr:TonB-dependent siderophore receptor [Pseudomonas sp.]